MGHSLCHGEQEGRVRAPERLALVKTSAEHEPMVETADVHEPLLTAAQVAKLLGIRCKRVYELPIPHVRISERSLRWSRADLMHWISERRERG
jgi:predicted DNA-binding transcriptional regulator AlpA